MPIRPLHDTLDSGLNAFNNTSRVASDPTNARALTVNFRPQPMPASLSQTSRPGTAPNSDSNRQCLTSRSAVVREESIIAFANRGNEDTITSPGGELTCP